MTDRRPHCAVVIPTYNGGALTAGCLEALFAHPPQSCSMTVVVVDDASPDPGLEALAGFRDRIVLRELERNLGFAGACNAGAAAAGERDHVVFLNNDTIPSAGWLDALVEVAEADDEIAAVGAKLLFPNGTVQHAGVAIHQNGLPFHLYAGLDASHPAVNRDRDVAAVTAACVLIRASDFDGLGGFDEAYHNAYEDVDLCLRLRELDRRVRYCHRSVVVHLESVTRFPDGVAGGVETSEGIYEQRWRSRVIPDDIAHYAADGLLRASFEAACPVTFTVAPELGVIQRDGAQLADVDRLLAARSQQVMRLLSAQTRRELKDRAGPPPPLLSAAPQRAPRPLHGGREHRLGHGGGRLISILLPVKNGGRYLGETIDGVLAQTVSARVEIVAIDSGSTDDTVEVLASRGVRVWAIDASDFDHGLTRNQLAELAGGEILVYLTQMARPRDERWLAPLLAALDADPQVAGVCSRLIPRPDADHLTRRDGLRDLCGAADPRRIEIGDWRAYERMDAETRRRFLNFHTVSTAIRADAIARTPFRSVRTLGEDLLWAREVVEDGWALVHEPASAVLHSHPYSFGELLGRNVDDGVANHDIIDRVVDEAEIVPRIRAQVADDWRYLRDELGLSGAELERCQLEATLRRATQTIGQWLGANYETLPDGVAAHFSNVAQIRAGTVPSGAEDG